MWCFKFPNLFSLFEILLPPPSASVFFDSRARVLYAPPRSSSPVLGLFSLRSQLPPLFPCWSLLDREFGSEGFSSRPNSSLPLSFFCRRQRSIFAACDFLWFHFSVVVDLVAQLCLECPPVCLAEGTSVFIDCCRCAQVAFAIINQIWVVPIVGGLL
jgi:hypothetical protein